MTEKELIQFGLELSGQATERLVADMRDAPLTQPTSAGGNHPLWTLGHLAFIEGSIPQILFGEPNPVEHWKPLFAPGTEPTTDAAAYPTFDEVLSTYRDLRAGNLERLKALDDDQLAQPPAAIPAGFEDAMKTVGHTLLLTSLHNMVHYGQIADARRVAGRKPLI